MKSVVTFSALASLALVHAAGIRAAAPIGKPVNDVEEAIAGGAALESLHLSRRIRDEHKALDLPSQSIDMESLQALGLNMVAPLSMAENPNELMQTKQFEGKLTSKHLQLLDKSTKKAVVSLTIAAMKMPVIDLPSSDRCFQVRYQAGGEITPYAFCAPTTKEAKKWITGIMAARFVQNAGVQPGKTEEESKLPENSTKDYRWYKHVQEQKASRGSAQGDDLMTPEEFAKSSVVNVEVRNAHRTPQVTVNGHKIDYTKS